MTKLGDKGTLPLVYGYCSNCKCYRWFKHISDSIYGWKHYCGFCSHVDRVHIRVNVND